MGCDFTRSSEEEKIMSFFADLPIRNVTMKQYSITLSEEIDSHDLDIDHNMIYNLIFIKYLTLPKENQFHKASAIIFDEAFEKAEKTKTFHFFIWGLMLLCKPDPIGFRDNTKRFMNKFLKPNQIFPDNERINYSPLSSCLKVYVNLVSTGSLIGISECVSNKESFLNFMGGYFYKENEELFVEQNLPQQKDGFVNYQLFIDDCHIRFNNDEIRDKLIQLEIAKKANLKLKKK